jgi:hypothetical protein
VGERASGHREVDTLAFSNSRSNNDQHRQQEG